MKQKFHSIGLLLFLVFLLISTSRNSARKLASKEGEANEKINISGSKKSAVAMENIYSFPNLMGLEECQNEDEDCTKRRVLAEAHLDYIYTQHHKP